MSFRKVIVKNFKSFKELEVELGNFNVLIGPNASGKSNFVQIFTFLRDIANHGLENAISMQGGVEYLRNIKLDSSTKFYLKIVLDNKFKRITKMNKQLIGIESYETAYEFSLTFQRKSPKFIIDKDILTISCDFIKLKKIGKKVKPKEKLGSGKIIISRGENSILNFDIIKPKGIKLSKRDVFSPFVIDKVKLPKNVLLLETPFFFIPFPISLKIFSGISIYDFDPKLPKKAAPITGKLDLEEDGSNLSIVIKNIIENKEKRRKLLNLVKDLLPFIESLDVEKFADRSLLFKLKESYFKEQYLPASLISDGTINITALIIALYFEKKELTIIEEPERNIHPHLISRVVDMMKDAARKKQIIVTTHNPEIVKYAGLENLLLVSRDKDGFSKIYRPMDKQEIREFLKNEIGIDELFVQNLLGE